MQFTPAGASAAHQKLGAGPPGRPVEAASAGGAPERVRAAQFAIPRSSGQRGPPGCDICAQRTGNYENHIQPSHAE